MRFFIIFFAALAICAETASASEGLIFDNGAARSEIGGAAYPMTSAVQAEDFSLLTSQTIVGVRFWALERSHGYAGSILWSIRTDNAGKPSSTSIASDLAAPSRTATGFLNDDYFDAAQFIYDLAIAPLTLDAGHYWLTLHNGPLIFDLDDNSNHFLLWEGSDLSSLPGNPGVEDAKPFDDVWQVPFRERAFQLVGVPEPSALAMFASVIGLLSARKRGRV